MPTPYNYLNASCQVPQTFDNPEAALSLWESMYKPANCPSEYYTPKGMDPLGVRGVYQPDIAVPAFRLRASCAVAEPSVAPWYGGGGQETLAWLIFEIKGQSSPTGCTERSPFLSAEGSTPARHDLPGRLRMARTAPLAAITAYRTGSIR